MRYAFAAALSLLLLWRLAPAVAVNAGNIDLMHAVMAEARPRPAASYAAPPRVGGEKMARAARAFALGGHDRLALRGAAQTMLWRGDYRSAASAIDEALERGGGFRERMLAGEAHLRTGDRQRGIAEWSAASTQAGLLLPLGVQLLEQLRDGGAAEAPQRAREVVAVLRGGLAQRGLTAQGRSLLLRTIAQAYEAIDDWRSAEEVVRPLASGGQPDPDALAMLAGIALRGQRWADAERFARAAIARDTPRTRWAPHYVLGLLALNRCDLDGAARHFRDGLAAPYDGDYNYHNQRWFLGVVAYERGDSPAALADWRTYMEAQPNDADKRDRVRQAAAGTLSRRCAAGTPPP
jgi:tetratricopeptide (TPR) repeat protein